MSSTYGTRSSATSRRGRLEATSWPRRTPSASRWWPVRLVAPKTVILIGELLTKQLGRHLLIDPDYTGPANRYQLSCPRWFVHGDGSSRCSGSAVRPLPPRPGPGQRPRRGCYVSGKLATLRWVLGSVWDFLDTWRSPSLTCRCGSAGEPRHCRNGVRPAVRASGGLCWGGTACRLPRRQA